MVVTINTAFVHTSEPAAPIAPPPPISPLVGAWGDQPWSRGNSEIVQTAGGDLPALNPAALQMLDGEHSDGEHSEHSAAMTAEAAHEEESPEHSAVEAEAEHEASQRHAKQASDYWPEESEVNPQPDATPESVAGQPAHYAHTGYGYDAPCACADCAAYAAPVHYAPHQHCGYDATYTHSPYQPQARTQYVSGYSHYAPPQTYHHHPVQQHYYNQQPERCACPNCVAPVHQKRVFRYNLPPPPPITADTVLQNTPALQHIMFKWYHKVQDIELGPVPPCPPPATDSYEPGYSFHQWMAMCSEWYHTHFFTGRVRRQNSPTPSPRPSYPRWGNGY